MSNLKELCKRVTDEFELDMNLVDSATPINVYLLTTACESVTRYYMDKLSEEVRKKFTNKVSVTGLFRQLLNNLESNGGNSETETLLYSRFLEYPGNKPETAAKVKMVMTGLKKAFSSGRDIRVHPRLEFMKSPYYRYISAGTDLAIIGKRKLVLIQISYSKEYHEYSSPATTETAILLKMLMALITYPEITSVQYRIVLAGDIDAADVCFELNSGDLTEDPEQTVLRLISFYSRERKKKGNDCVLCPHRNYCPMLKEALEEYAAEVTHAN